jgi:hypothetical protein
MDHPPSLLPPVAAVHAPLVPAIASERAHFDELESTRKDTHKLSAFALPFAPATEPELESAPASPSSSRQQRRPQGAHNCMARCSQTRLSPVSCTTMRPSHPPSQSHSAPSARAAAVVMGTVCIPSPGSLRASTLAPPRSASFGTQPAMALAS